MPAASRAFALAVAAFVVIAASADCASTASPSPTPCPGFEGWPPTDLPAPPASVRITRPPGSAVQVTNGTDAPLKIRYRVWTPGDCAAMPSLQAQLETSVIAPGKLAEWSGNDIVPGEGPVLGGIEVWTHPCDETCGDPPDAFASFDVRPPSN